MSHLIARTVRHTVSPAHVVKHNRSRRSSKPLAGELPPPESFTSHGRPHNLPKLGPFPSRATAEARLRRHLSCRDPENRPPPLWCPPARAMAMTDEQRRWLYVLAAAIGGGLPQSAAGLVRSSCCGGSNGESCEAAETTAAATAKPPPAVASRVPAKNTTASPEKASSPGHRVRRVCHCGPFKNNSGLLHAEHGLTDRHTILRLSIGRLYCP
jgi:hypothetical protein